jgi:MYXO-CTERM domain-containing protein
MDAVLGALSKRDQRKCKDAIERCEDVRERCTGWVTRCNADRCKEKARCRCSDQLEECQGVLMDKCGLTFSTEFEPDEGLQGGCTVGEVEHKGVAAGLLALLLGLALLVRRQS